MLKAEFDEWLDDSVTKCFLQYLRDSAKEESKIVADMIMGGDIVPLDDQLRISTLAITLIQTAEVSFDEIEGFYQQ